MKDTAATDGTQRQGGGMTNRDLDRAVAEALGYTMYHYDKDVKENCYYMLMDPQFNQVAFTTNWRDGAWMSEEAAWEDCPDFSTDIAAAFTVLAALEAQGARWIIERYTDEYRVRVLMPPASGVDEYGATTATLPAAICHAALVALKGTP